MRALVVEPEILFLDEPFSALDYEMTLFMREQLQRLFMESRYHNGVGLPRSRGGGLSRGPSAAVVTPPRARRGLRGVWSRRGPRTDATLSDPEFVRTKAHCLEVFQREVRRDMRARKLEPFLPLVGRRRPACGLDAGDLGQVGRPGAAAVAGLDLQRAVERHGWRHARARFRQDRLPYCRIRLRSPRSSLFRSGSYSARP